jgi:putative membrane protein
VQGHVKKVPAPLRLFIGLFSLWAVAACDGRIIASAMASPGKPELSTGEATQQFLTRAAENSRLEIQAAKLAAEKATQPGIKLFAQMMIAAHSRVSDSLAQLAIMKGLELPAGPGKEGAALIQKLTQLSGEDFDELYLTEMLKAHQKALSDFNEASRSAPDADIQNFARSQLPVLRDHFRVAQTLSPAERG